MKMRTEFIRFVLIFTVIGSCYGQSVYVDKGNPYAVGPLETGELTITTSTKDSPRHVKVYFPLGTGEFSVIYYIGGFSSVIPAEAYSIILSKVAAHGFFVFGVDYYYPLANAAAKVGEDVNVYFTELLFLEKYMVNKTIGVPRWDDLGILCHSAGCDISLKMIEMNAVKFKAVGFLEPYSQLVHERSSMQFTVPALMYGTQLSEDGFPACNVKGYDYEQFLSEDGFPACNVKGYDYEQFLSEDGFPACNVKGYDYEQFYQVWRCPRVAIKVADFGHCDMLDPVYWDVCHITHFCKTTNNTMLNHYRQTAHGIVSSFFMATLQHRSDALSFITDQTQIPIKMLVDKADWTC